MSGDDDVYDGMTDSEIMTYLTSINVYGGKWTDDSNTSFGDIKKEMRSQEDPILGTFSDFYNIGSNNGHAIVIIGYYDDGGDEYCVIVDTEICVTTYILPFDYLTNRTPTFIYTDGTGMAG